MRRSIWPPTSASDHVPHGSAPPHPLDAYCQPFPPVPRLSTSLGKYCFKHVGLTITYLSFPAVRSPQILSMYDVRITIAYCAPSLILAPRCQEIAVASKLC